MTESQRTPSRIRTRFIAVLALITSGITLGSGLMVFLYMKSPAFENQLLGQVMKNSCLEIRLLKHLRLKIVMDTLS